MFLPGFVRNGIFSRNVGAGLAPPAQNNDASTDVPMRHGTHL